MHWLHEQFAGVFLPRIVLGRYVAARIDQYKYLTERHGSHEKQNGCVGCVAVIFQLHTLKQLYNAYRSRQSALAFTGTCLIVLPQLEYWSELTIRLFQVISLIYDLILRGLILRILLAQTVV